MQSARMSVEAARNYRNTLVWSKSLLGIALIISAWALGAYRDSTLMILVLALTASWATVCHLAEGLIFGRVLNPDLFGVFFIILVAPSPAAIPILTGVLAGLIVYSLLVGYIVWKPHARLMRGSRLYKLRHPLERLIPFVYLAPEPLAPIFSPVPAFHWSIAAFNIPILRFSIFDPLSIHNYIKNRTSRLTSLYDDWTGALTCFRSAVGIINLLDALRRFEQIDLDGVALAASARLALSKIPDQGRNILVEVLRTLKPSRRKLILSAFDLSQSRVF